MSSTFDLVTYIFMCFVFCPIGPALGLGALPLEYFYFLIPCILLCMALATSIKKAYVERYGELLQRRPATTLVKERNMSWSQIWMDVFGATEWLGLNIGFWVAGGV